MARYINLNSSSLPPLNSDYSGIFSRVMKAGSNINTNTLFIIVGILLFVIVAVFYYFYYVAPSSKIKYDPNVGSGKNNGTNKAELLFFYADWCPHCKAAKPIWNDLKTEYEDKLINGYQIVFTEVDCSEETSEVEKMMNQYNIEGYPTIKLLKDGQVIEYDAKPSKDVLINFLNTVL